MGFYNYNYNRRLLLLNEDVPISESISPLPQIEAITPTATNSSSPPNSMPTSTTMFRSPLQLPLRPILTSNVAYTFLVLFSALFMFAFILLSVREFQYRRRRRRPPFGGVEISTVKSLPVSSYQGETKQPDCVICLEEFRDCDTVKMIPFCKHVFHPECIDTWLSSHVTCPICRCVLYGSNGGAADQQIEGSTAENGGSREVG